MRETTKQQNAIDNMIQLKIVLLTAFVGGFWGILNGAFAITIVIKTLVLIFLALFILYKITNGVFTNRWQDNFITLFVLCLLINFIACWINRGQNIWDSLQSDEVCNMLFLLFFYLLIKIKSNVNNIERCIVVLYTIFITCYFMQYFLFYPNPIFRMIGINTDWVNYSFSEHRFRMMSQMIGFIGYFFFLNKVLTERYKPFYYYWGILSGLIFVILLGFRMGVVAVVISSLYLMFRIKGVNMRQIGRIIAFAIFVLVVVQIPAVQEQIGNMVTRQSEGQVFNNKEYVRNEQLYYFINVHAINRYDFFSVQECQVTALITEEDGMMLSQKRGFMVRR